MQLMLYSNIIGRNWEVPQSSEFGTVGEGSAQFDGGVWQWLGSEICGLPIFSKE